MIKRLALCLMAILLFATSDSSQSKHKSSSGGSAPAQKQFKIFSECICSCTAVSISFIYEGDFRIDVMLGGCGHDPSVGFNKGKIEKEFNYYSRANRFVDKKTNRDVNPTLKKLLLDVYNLAAYCQDHKMTSGTFSESGRFQALNKLRLYLKL